MQQLKNEVLEGTYQDLKGKIELYLKDNGNNNYEVLVKGRGGGAFKSSITHYKGKDMQEAMEKYAEVKQLILL